MHHSLITCVFLFRNFYLNNCNPLIEDRIATPSLSIALYDVKDQDVAAASIAYEKAVQSKNILTLIFKNGKSVRRTPADKTCNLIDPCVRLTVPALLDVPHSVAGHEPPCAC